MAVEVPPQVRKRQKTQREVLLLLAAFAVLTIAAHKPLLLLAGLAMGAVYLGWRRCLP